MASQKQYKDKKEELKGMRKMKINK